MKRIVLSIQDDQKAETLLALLHDLSYVEARVEDVEKVWKGDLTVFDNPINIPDFKMYTREELHER